VINGRAHSDQREPSATEANSVGALVGLLSVSSKLIVRREGPDFGMLASITTSFAIPVSRKVSRESANNVVTDASTANGNNATSLADELLVLRFTMEPIGATLLGLPGYDDRLGNPSEEAEAEARAKAVDIAERAEAAKPGASAADALTLSVVAQQALATVDEIDSRMIEYTITDLFVAPASTLLNLLPMTVLQDSAHAESYLRRLNAIPGYLDAVAQRHRAGISHGLRPVAHLVQAAVAHLDRYLAGPEEDPLRRPAAPADGGRFDADRDRVLTEVVRPAFATYREVLASEIAAHGRSAEQPGLCWLPDGERLYAALSRAHTTTSQTPEQLHQTGLDLMNGLAEEFAEIGSRVFGTTERAEIFRRMRTDPALRWRDADELLDAARAAIQRAEAEAPRWFGRLPASRCRVEPVPSAEAPGAPAAYYMQPSLDGLRPGTYFANTYRAHERDRYTSEVTAFHEAVPGHHLQLALAGELTELPLFRRLANVNAYSEGWGLYCERLAEQMGLYTDDVARLGMLTMDAVRAGRLVVDTGLHAKGWSRARAVGYLTDNVPASEVEIATEVNRYIAYPGQALSYMVGRLEIQRIRAAAERRLGSRFDIKGFHDTVLGNGQLPLSVLDEVVSGWADNVAASL
jgi:uncharacterized protein (DUF885 family)